MKAHRLFVKFCSLSLLGMLMFGQLASGCPICQQEILQGGRCININGNQLYLQIIGVKSPIVIFEAGLDDSSSSWDKVVPQAQ